jgi:RNA polymerase sigma factor (TIGR02999 family)
MEAADRGSKPAADALFSALYGQLRRIARNELARHGAPVSLSATTLLHQAYFEIAGREGVSFPDRNRFMGYAARVMRGLIIDHARGRCAQKRGGQFEITAIGSEVENVPNCRELARISDALEELAKAEPSLAEIVDLKFFCGLLSLAKRQLIDCRGNRVCDRHIRHHCLLYSFPHVLSVFMPIS